MSSSPRRKFRIKLFDHFYNDTQSFIKTMVASLCLKLFFMKNCILIRFIACVLKLKSAFKLCVFLYLNRNRQIITVFLANDWLQLISLWLFFNSYTFFVLAQKNLFSYLRIFSQSSKSKIIPGSCLVHLDKSSSK